MTPGGPSFPSKHTHAPLAKSPTQCHQAPVRAKDIQIWLCPKKLNSGGGGAHGKSPQTPTSPEGNGHRDRALARKAGRAQADGRTPRNWRGSMPVPNLWSCPLSLTWTVAPAPTLVTNYPFGGQRNPAQPSVPLHSSFAEPPTCSCLLATLQAVPDVWGHPCPHPCSCPHKASS